MPFFIEKTPSTIDSFTGKYQCFSNFYPRKVIFNTKTKIWKFQTSEHAYQAMKATNEKDFLYIATSPSPGTAKRRGQNISIRNDWDLVKDKTMLKIVREKFLQNKDCRLILLNTKHAPIEEGNYWGDTYWGTVNGIGQNKLGLILMYIRSKLQ